MMIDKIFGTTQVNNVQNTHRTNETVKRNSGSDSISVSEAAKEKAAIYYMNQIAAETPDVREDRIAEVRAKLQDPNYINNAILEATADKLMESFGL